MAKICVFCGHQPQDKNKEHIIPKWLIKLTKSEGSLKTVGIDLSVGEEINLNLYSYTFPACTTCNTNFSIIEAQVKPIVERILKDGYVTGAELLLLLDWFDKIRVCLWLAMKIRNDHTITLEPKYYVNTRVGKKDRMLAITNTYDGLDELWWTGMHTLAFLVSPTCFTMKINNVIFNNCSMDFILSEQLGFPYALYEKQNIDDSNLQDFAFTAGKEKVVGKLFQTPFYKDTTIIAQTIFTEAKRLNPKRYDTEYVKNNFYDYSNGIGKIFVSHEGITYSMEMDEEISFQSKDQTPKRLPRNRIALGFQLELLTARKLVFNNALEKKRHQIALRHIIEMTEEQIKQYDY